MLLASLLASGWSPSAAQVQSGATLTVLRGTVGVLQASGSAVQPAVSGLSLDVGDQIATLESSGALVTFFEGSEVELGADTTIINRQMARQGTQTNISLESIVG